MAAAGAVGGCSATGGEEPSTSPTPGVDRVPATGAHQAGVVTPAVPQSHLLVAVYDLTGPPGPALAALGRRVLALTAGTDANLLGLEPGDLTVTVGVGPRLVAAVDPDLPGAQDLDRYPFEELQTTTTGGDVWVQVCASDPLLPPLALSGLEAEVADLRPRWRQEGLRGPVETITASVAAARNVLGFADGIVGPTVDQLDQNVWIPGPGPVTGGTIVVVRRMVIDVPGFTGMDLPDQEAAIGRTREGSVPLSGTVVQDPINLQAKSPDGRYLIPTDAHVRRAHAGAAGVALMLRRSYSMTDPLGLVFVSFQNELRAFSATMSRMAEGDALLERTVSTATGTFLVLPGFDEERPLGSGLFG